MQTKEVVKYMPCASTKWYKAVEENYQMTMLLEAGTCLKGS